jgi:hypothetical protein
MTSTSRGDAPALLLMGVFYLAFGVYAIVRPDKLRLVFDKFANSWKKGSWHPYRMALPVLRWVVGGVGVIGAVLCFYIAYQTLHR